MLQRETMCGESSPVHDEPLNRPALRWLEALGLAVAVPALGALVQPADLFFRTGGPWALGAVMLMALQCGMLPTAAGVSMLLGGAGLEVWLRQQSGAGLLSWSVGLVVVAAVTGRLGRSHAQRIAELEVARAELASELETAERARAVTELSHTRLKQRLEQGECSLETAVLRAEKAIGASRSYAQACQAVLDLLASQAQVQAAEFVPMVSVGQATRRLAEEPLAWIGKKGSGASGSPVVARALASGRTCWIEASQEAGPVPSDAAVVAVPVIASSRQWLGVIAVRVIPFVSYRRDNLRALGTLVSGVADALNERRPGSDRVRPSAPSLQVSL